MRAFASWWERVPVRHFASAITVIAVVALVGVQIGQVKPAAQIPVGVHVTKSVGELWT